MLVSVIIPTYGHPSFLFKSINSVVNQSYKNWELIVVDDNDPLSEARKETESIISRFSDARMIYIKHDRNRNGAAARNTGLVIAKGDIISFLDSDDEYVPERLERCIGALSSAPQNVAGVYTGCEFRRNGRVYHIERKVKSGVFLKATLACTFMFCTGSNLFVRRQVINELNGFDESFARHQDYEFLVRLFERYSLVGLPEVLVIKNNENINLPSVDKQIRIKEQYLNKYKSIIDSLPVTDQNFIYHSNAIEVAENALRCGRISLARDYYTRARCYSQLSVRERGRFLLFLISGMIKHSST